MLTENGRGNLVAVGPQNRFNLWVRMLLVYLDPRNHTGPHCGPITVHFENLECSCGPDTFLLTRKFCLSIYSSGAVYKNFQKNFPTKMKCKFALICTLFWSTFRGLQICCKIDRAISHNTNPCYPTAIQLGQPWFDHLSHPVAGSKIPFFSQILLFISFIN